MTTKARAAVIERKDAPFVMHDVSVEDPRPDEVLVRMVATGICATDAHVRQQLLPTPLPAILGHEGAGIVERVGSTVTHLKPGDHVVLSYNSCGQCKPCLSSHPAYCDKVLEANFAGARLDGSIGVNAQEAGDLHAHFFGQSSFATYALAHQRNTVKVPSDIPLEILGPLGCGLQTGAGAILKAMEVPVGATVAIFIRQIEQRGVEFVLDTSGRASNLDAGISALAPLGCFGFVAFSADSGAMVDASRLAVGQTLQGIIQGDAVSALMIPQLIGLYRSGRFPFDRLITFYDFSDINQAFDDVAAGRVIKAVLRF